MTVTLALPSPATVNESQNQYVCRPCVWVCLVLLMTGLLIAAALIIHSRLSIPLIHLTDDPNSIGKLKLFTGLFTYISIMLWSSCAAVALLASVLHYRFSTNRDLARFFGLIAISLFYFAADDALMLHEAFLPKLIGIGENAFLVAYMVLALLFIYLYFRQIRQTALPLLAIAGGFFFMSLVIDIATHGDPVSSAGYKSIIEDGFKIAGILSVMAYLLQSSVQTLAASLTQGAPDRTADADQARQ